MLCIVKRTPLSLRLEEATKLSRRRTVLTHHPNFYFSMHNTARFIKSKLVAFPAQLIVALVFLLKSLFAS